MSKILICILFSVSLSGAANWKYYAFTNDTNSHNLFLFDSSSIKQNEDGNIIVWTKIIDTPDFDTSDSAIGHATLRKIKNGYIPPCSSINETNKIPDSNQFVERVIFTYWEIAANNKTTKTPAIFLYEINLKKKMNRTLSSTVYQKDGKIISNNSPGEWEYIVPESIFENLYKIITHSHL